MICINIKIIIIITIMALKGKNEAKEKAAVGVLFQQ